jgi:transposase
LVQGRNQGHAPVALAGYRQAHPDGFQYSRFCELYREWAGTLDPVLRQTHEPGQKAGQTVRIQQPDGTTTPASLFVAVLGRHL